MNKKIVYWCNYRNKFIADGYFIPRHYDNGWVKTYSDDSVDPRLIAGYVIDGEFKLSTDYIAYQKQEMAECQKKIDLIKEYKYEPIA